MSQLFHVNNYLVLLNYWKTMKEYSIFLQIKKMRNGACAGAYMGGNAHVIMQNQRLGYHQHLVTLIQYYRMPLPILISYREVGEKFNAKLKWQFTLRLFRTAQDPTYHFHEPKDADEFDSILNHTFMAKKPVAILTDANFWSSIS